MKKDKTVNGMTVTSSGNYKPDFKCYCERKMKKSNGDKKYKSCIIYPGKLFLLTALENGY